MDRQTPRPLITVFGGTGFLGRRVVRCLAEGGAHVRVVARGVRDGLADSVAEPMRADIRDRDSVAAAVRGAAGVVNAVSLYVERSDVTFQCIHVEGAASVAEEARQAGVRRLVHVSGIGVESSSPSRYVRARAMGERRVREAFPRASVLRPSVLFGPGDSFLRAIDDIGATSPLFPLFGVGDTRLQPVYVDDVAAAVARVVDGSTRGASVFELGGPRTYRYREIVDLVLSHRKRRRLLVPVPFLLWRLAARAFALSANRPLTPDQVILMSCDNVVGADADGFAALGIEPRALESLLGECLPS